MERGDASFGRESFVRSLSLSDDLDVLTIFALESGLTASCFSATKYGVEAEGEESPKTIGAVAKAEEKRGFGRAGDTIEEMRG